MQGKRFAGLSKLSFDRTSTISPIAKNAWLPKKAFEENPYKVMGMNLQNYTVSALNSIS